jgi:hypothetical protein
MQATGEAVMFLLSDCTLTKIFGVSYDMGASIFVYMLHLHIMVLKLEYF